MFKRIILVTAVATAPSMACAHATLVEGDTVIVDRATLGCDDPEVLWDVRKSALNGWLLSAKAAPADRCKTIDRGVTGIVIGAVDRDEGRYIEIDAAAGLWIMQSAADKVDQEQ